MHPSEDELILHYYGEDGAAEAGVERHLASCEAFFAATEADGKRLGELFAQ